ncbi:DUF7691 family protein [Actinomadura chibensis]|uniref:DUF7691 domain-containing protein n=1 Tax=Actinomadura chibensis TaxID=392828 RepID=A0A5D0NZJ0_9ACTN|nr:hypothetical protein [Actinomadura chibensis]TYB49578.1 hypothetical protein FXF69_11020 [Actinomadura chibensis]
MSTQLRLYSVSLGTLDILVRPTNVWLAEESRTQAAAIDAEGYVKGSRTVTEALEDILHDRPKDPDAGNAYGHAWEIVIEQLESKRFDFGPMKLGARFLDEASSELKCLDVPAELTPVGFMYNSPFTGTPHPSDLPAIGHLPASQVAALLTAYQAAEDRLTNPDHKALAHTIITAAEEVVDFNRFADGMEDEDIPYCDLVTFYS